MHEERHTHKNPEAYRDGKGRLRSTLYPSFQTKSHSSAAKKKNERKKQKAYVNFNSVLLFFMHIFVGGKYVESSKGSISILNRLYQKLDD